MFQSLCLIYQDNIFDFNSWEKSIDVQQEIKTVDLLDCWLLYLQIENQEIVLLVIGGQMKVDRHPGLQKAWQMIFS